MVKVRQRKRFVDHTGREFDSIYAMCRYWGINQNKYYWRRRAGASVGEALNMSAYLGSRR